MIYLVKYQVILLYFGISGAYILLTRIINVEGPIL